MNTSKYIILLLFMVLFPLFAVGQIRNITKREAEQLGKNTYTTLSGEVTKVVYTVGSGLDNEYAKFLYLKTGDAEVDSIFSEISSNYSSLEEAALDIDRLLKDVNTEKRENFEGNNGLGFRISQGIRNLRKKEQEATKRVDELLSKDPTVEELTTLYLEYGDKPTYYINGVEVHHNLVNQLYPNEVIKREIRTTDTASGNPNGEIWYMVSEKALNRIKIPIEQTYNYMSNTAVASSSSPSGAKEKSLSNYLLEKEREKIKSSLKAEPVVRRETTVDGKHIDRVVSEPAKNEKSNTNAIKEESSSDAIPGTRVRSRTINNENVGTNPNDPVMKALQNRRSQPVFRQNNSLDTDSQILPSPIVRSGSSTAVSKVENRKAPEPEIEKSNDMPESTPKRSVRRIKERQRSEYLDGAVDQAME
jgi:hypothetical protein